MFLTHVKCVYVYNKKLMLIQFSCITSTLHKFYLPVNWNLDSTLGRFVIEAFYAYIFYCHNFILHNKIK